MFIIVRVTNVYGNRTVYPVCSKAKIFAMLANTKTLTTPSLELIKALGYEIRLQQEVL